MGTAQRKHEQAKRLAELAEQAGRQTQHVEDRIPDLLLQLWRLAQEAWALGRRNEEAIRDVELTQNQQPQTRMTRAAPLP